MLLTVMPMTACGDSDGPVVPRQPEAPRPPEKPGDGDDGSGATDTSLRVRVGELVFTAMLEDNATTRAFTALLPMTVTMGELNGNEKYCYLDRNLPVNASRPGTIRAGDLMLYGSNCLVLFYETFSSSYSYTTIGRLNHPSGLAAAVGQGSVMVTFEQ